MKIPIQSNYGVEIRYPDEIKILVVGDKEKFDKPLDSFGKVNVIELQ